METSVPYAVKDLSAPWHFHLALTQSTSWGYIQYVHFLLLRLFPYFVLVFKMSCFYQELRICDLLVE